MSDYWRHKVEEHEEEILRDQIERELESMERELDCSLDQSAIGATSGSFYLALAFREIARLRVKTRALR